MLRAYRNFIAEAPEEVGGFFAFLVVPPVPMFPEHLHLKTVCGVVWCYTGPTENLESALKPMRGVGHPLLDSVGPAPFPVVQSLFDALYPAGTPLCLPLTTDLAQASSGEPGPLPRQVRKRFGGWYMDKNGDAAKGGDSRKNGKRLSQRHETNRTIGKLFSYRMAIVKLNLGETNEEAWHRHLVEHPGDINANIRVFNSSGD